MLSDQIIHLIEHQSKRLVDQWISSVRENVATPSYHDFDDEDLAVNIREVYRHFGQYIKASHDQKQLANLFIRIGAQRREQRIPLNELVFAIMLARRNLWTFLSEEIMSTSAIDYHKTNEFWHLVMDFFDKNIYYVILGYESNKKVFRSKKNTASSFIHAASLGIFPEIDSQSLQSD
jgi:hypothetical protein